MMFPSGFHVEFDISKPPGSRVRSISILCTKCRVPHYEPLKDEMVYTVVIPSYMVAGGDGYSVIRDETIKHNSGEMFGCKEGFLVLCCEDETFHRSSRFPAGHLDVSVVSNYIMQRKQVYPAVEGRIKIYNSASALGGQSALLVLLVSLVLLWTLCGSK